VTYPITSDDIDIAEVVDQVIESCGGQQKLSDSIHVPKGRSIVNLLSDNLHHKLNTLWHKLTSERPDFITIITSSIPELNRLDKLECIRNIFQPLIGYLDLNWIYHNHQSAIIVEFVNKDLMKQAHHIIASTHHNLKTIIIENLRQLLNHSKSNSTHIPRYHEYLQITNHKTYNSNNTKNKA